MIERADDKFMGTNHNVLKMGENAFRDVLTMKPSEYFERNCWVGASTPTPSEVASSRAHRAEQPHVGQRLPAPRRNLAAHASGWRSASTTCRKSSVGRSSLSTRSNCYPGFDGKKLEATAERIGPTVHDVHVAPVPANPDVVAGLAERSADTFV